MDQRSSDDCFKVWGMPHTPEDIVFCVDADSQIDTELKVPGSKGQALTRLDAVKQALLLFVHSKLIMSREHRFAIATIGQSASWHLQQFVSDYDAFNASIRTLTSQGSFPKCDLSSLFHLVLPDAKASKHHNRSFRVILIYCRSNVVPSLTKNLPENLYSSKNFMFDALYLHDKPSSTNCPQQVYDILVEILERVHMHGYIYESGSGLSRILFRHICQLLSHPQQRSMQEDSLPKDLSKSSPVAAEGTTENQ